jgi:LysM repeat protein
MNRKDTILVAVLVNIGVLLILFVSALKPHSTTEWQAQAVRDSSTFDDQKAALSRVENKQLDAKNESIPKEFSQAIEQLFKIENGEDKVMVADFVAPQKVIDPSLHALEVKSGDVLEKIAKTNGVSVDEIKKINQLSDDKLQIGQVLYLPQTLVSKNTQPSSIAPTQVAKTVLSEDRYYTVKNGDSPWTIATKNHIKVEDLLRLNGLDEVKAKKIKPGDRLRIK